MEHNTDESIPRTETVIRSSKNFRSRNSINKRLREYYRQSHGTCMVKELVVNNLVLTV